MVAAKLLEYLIEKSGEFCQGAGLGAGKMNTYGNTSRYKA
jgi:hypothetical protein